jgi:hypothetical protein
VSEHSPIEVRSQVWHSLVSMLRVYAHAATLNGKEFIVTVDSDTAAVVSYGDCLLEISFSPGTGAAIWRISRPEGDERGNFEIDSEGAVHFPAGPKELDAAAMDWMDNLSSVCALEVYPL